MKKNVILGVALTALMGVLNAQVEVPVGFGISNPAATLHLHDTVDAARFGNADPFPGVNPPGPFNPQPVNGGGSSVNSVGNSLSAEYKNLFLMTNPRTGSTVDDGFQIFQHDMEVTVQQREAASFRLFNHDGVGLIMDSAGHFGIAASTQNSYMLNVGGKVRATGVYVEGGLNASKAYIDKSLNAKVLVASDSLRVGNGLRCGTDGVLYTKELRVTLDGWYDHVFDANYSLMGLGELETYVAANRHLPDIPSAAEVEADGISVGEMNALLLKKVEELTLYIIDLQHQIDELKK